MDQGPHECNDLGRHEDALAACLEALQVFRGLAAAHGTRGSRRDLAFTLGNLCHKFTYLNRQQEGLVAGHEALELWRQLLDGTPAASRDLAKSLINCGKCESELGRKAVALALFKEATETLRSFASKANDMLHMLALSLGNMAAMLCDLQRRPEALDVQHEAVALYRRITAERVHAMARDFMRSLRNLSESARLLDQHDRAELAAAELGQVVLKFSAEDPDKWADYASFVAAQVISAEHARGYLLPLLESLAERRELAHNATHAARFLSLQSEVATRLWALLREHAATDPELVEDGRAYCDFRCL